LSAAAGSRPAAELVDQWGRRGRGRSSRSRRVLRWRWCPCSLRKSLSLPVAGRFPGGPPCLFLRCRGALGV